MAPHRSLLQGMGLVAFAVASVSSSLPVRSVHSNNRVAFRCRSGYISRHATHSKMGKRLDPLHFGDFLHRSDTRV